MKRFTNINIFVLCLFVYTTGISQELDSYKSKVSSLDSITHYLYDVISGDKGVERDWDLFKYLFASDAKLMPTRKGKDGKVQVMYMTPQDYIDRSGPWLLENGFHEKEIHRVTESFGNITHLFSTYAAYKSASDISPFMRGINSIQLLYDNERWWITNIYWQAESEELKLPAAYLD